MCIWNKILAGLIGVVLLVFFYMAARTLQTHKYWADLAIKHQRRIWQLKEENHRLFEGVAKQGEPARDGIRQVRLELGKLLMDRRRAWFNCDPEIKLNRDGGRAEITVTIDRPAPHGITEKTVLHAFEKADVRQEGRYLGQFAVSGVGDKKVTFAPTATLTPREIDRLATAKSPWVLYEIMPRDDHEIFAAIDDQQKKAMLPAGSLSEYLKDGKPAAEDDPKNRLVGGKYVRQLRDYDVLLDAEQAKRILLNDSIEAAVRDTKLVEDALAAARKQEEACKKDIAAAVTDLRESARQRDIVAAHREKLEKKLAELQAAVAQLIETNQAKAGQIAKCQLEAARRIDQRTRAMAQSGTERL